MLPARSKANPEGLLNFASRDTAGDSTLQLLLHLLGVVVTLAPPPLLFLEHLACCHRRRLAVRCLSVRGISN